MTIQGCQVQSNVQSEIFLTSKYFLLATLVKLLGAFCSPNNTVFTDWAHFVAQKWRNNAIVILCHRILRITLTEKYTGRMPCRDCSGSSHMTKSRDFGPGVWPGVGRDLIKRIVNFRLMNWTFKRSEILPFKRLNARHDFRIRSLRNSLFSSRHYRILESVWHYIYTTKVTFYNKLL